MIKSDDRVTLLSLHENEWLSLRKVVSPEDDIRGYVYSHETRCQGNIIAVIGYRWTRKKHFYEYEYLIRKEVTPCWGLDPQYSALTGGWEGNPDFRVDAVNELKEEAGYVVELEDMYSLGTCFGTKSTDTTFRLFAVDLEDKTQGEALGDGSKQDSEGTAHWMTYPEIAEKVNDPIVIMLISRLQRDILRDWQ